MSCPSQPDDAWIRLHYPRIHRSAWLLTGDSTASEDLAQEVFLVALDSWHRFEGRSSESTWLYGILMRTHQKRNRALARLRRRLQQYVDTGPRSQSREPDPSDQLAEKQWQVSVWALVADLPTDQQQAVTLRFAEQLSYQEIATVVGCRVGTAKSRVHHGLKRLRSTVRARLDGDSIDMASPGNSPNRDGEPTLRKAGTAQFTGVSQPLGTLEFNADCCPSTAIIPSRRSL